MSPVSCWPLGNQLIFPTRASDVLPSVPLLSHSLEPAAACGRQEEAPCWVSTVHPLSSLWKQLSVTSSQRKGILSRKTAKDGVTQLFASPSLASVFVLSCFPSPTPRRENSQSGSFTKSFFGNLVKMAGGDSRLRTSLANGDEMTKPPGPQLHVRTKSIQ